MHARHEVCSIAAAGGVSETVQRTEATCHLDFGPIMLAARAAAVGCVAPASPALDSFADPAAANDRPSSNGTDISAASTLERFVSCS